MSYGNIMKSIAKLIQQGVSEKIDLLFTNFVLRSCSSILVWPEVKNFLNQKPDKIQTSIQAFEANRVWLFEAETSA